MKFRMPSAPVVELLSIMFVGLLALGACLCVDGCRSILLDQQDLRRDKDWQDVYDADVTKTRERKTVTNRPPG